MMIASTVSELCMYVCTGTDELHLPLSLTSIESLQEIMKVIVSCFDWLLFEHLHCLLFLLRYETNLEKPVC